MLYWKEWTSNCSFLQSVGCTTRFDFGSLGFTIDQLSLVTTLTEDLAVKTYRCCVNVGCASHVAARPIPERIGWLFWMTKNSKSLLVLILWTILISHDDWSRPNELLRIFSSHRSLETVLQWLRIPWMTDQANLVFGFGFFVDVST